MYKNPRREAFTGFTLIELLVVIAIIGILASVVIASLNSARAKSRDTARIAQLEQIEQAINMYYLDNGYYPQIQDGAGFESSCGSQTENWVHCDRLNIIANLLSPYITLVPESMSNTTQGNYYYRYTSQSVDGWQTYGMMVYLETPNAGADDGGYYSNAWEVGTKIDYCKKYTGGGANWYTWNTVCSGGN